MATDVAVAVGEIVAVGEGAGVSVGDVTPLAGVLAPVLTPHATVIKLSPTRRLAAQRRRLIMRANMCSPCFKETHPHDDNTHHQDRWCYLMWRYRVASFRCRLSPARRRVRYTSRSRFYNSMTRRRITRSRGKPHPKLLSVGAAGSAPTGARTASTGRGRAARKSQLWRAGVAWDVHDVPR